jgi:hypothetical protein
VKSEIGSYVEFCPNCQNSQPSHHVILCPCGFVGCVPSNRSLHTGCYGRSCPWCGQDLRLKRLSEILNYKVLNFEAGFWGFLLVAGLHIFLNGYDIAETKKNTSAFAWFWRIMQCMKPTPTAAEKREELEREREEGRHKKREEMRKREEEERRQDNEDDYDYDDGY